MVLNYVVTPGSFLHAGATAMCLSANRCLSAVPSCAQGSGRRPACRHLSVTGCCASGCDRETLNNQTRESVLGTNTARVSALEMLCFDRLPGDFPSSWFNQSCW